MSDDGPWRDAFARLMTNEDVNPLAQMLLGSSPIPAWLRQELAELLRPMRPLLIVPYDGTRNFDPKSKSAELALKNADRLVFVRSGATRRKMKTYEKRIATGLAVLDAKAGGKSHGAAVDEVREKLKKVPETDPSYIDHSIALAKQLPAKLRRTARKLSDFEQ
jgi:hypothetical protein